MLRRLESAWKQNPHKKRPRTSYLEPNAELLSTNYNARNKVQAISVIRNGIFPQLKPMPFKEYVWVRLTYTTTGLCICDSCGFSQYVEILEDLSYLVKNLVKEAVTKKMYRIRATILGLVGEAASPRDLGN